MFWLSSGGCYRPCLCVQELIGGSLSPNNIDVPPLTLGVHWASGIVTPANPTYTVDELTFQLKDSGAKAIATLVELLPVVTKAAANAGIPEDRIILLGDTRIPKYKHWREIHDPTQTMKWRRSKIDAAKDMAFLVYSSGTTGHPKGVMLSHQNVSSDVLMLMVAEGSNLSWQNDRIIAFLPFFHIYGLTCGLIPRRGERIETDGSRFDSA
jgi:4-coumarate--CoA ligase